MYLMLSRHYSYSLGMGSSLAKPGIISRSVANPENEPVSLIFSQLTSAQYWQQALQWNCPSLALFLLYIMASTVWFRFIFWYDIPLAGHIFHFNMQCILLWVIIMNTLILHSFFGKWKRWIVVCFHFVPIIYLAFKLYLQFLEECMSQWGYIFW